MQLAETVVSSSAPFSPSLLSSFHRSHTPPDDLSSFCTSHTSSAAAVQCLHAHADKLHPTCVEAIRNEVRQHYTSAQTLGMHSFCSMARVAHWVRDHSVSFSHSSCGTHCLMKFFVHFILFLGFSYWSHKRVGRTGSLLNVILLYDVILLLILWTLAGWWQRLV